MTIGVVFLGLGVGELVTLLMPVLILTLVVLTIVQTRRQAPPLV